jgi:hypothetical protein
MVEHQLPEQTLTAIRDGVTRNQPFGDDAFVRRITNKAAS